MQEQAHKREELERVWKDPSFVRRYERSRKTRLRDFRQRSLQDEHGAWQRAIPEKGLNDNTPSSPVFSGLKTNQVKSLEKLKRRRKGDPAFILPEPEFSQEEGIRFRLAEGAGASPEQLARASAMYKAGLHAKAKRAAHCGVLGQRKVCARNPNHEFYCAYGCGNRYCPSCGPQSFARLFGKHIILQGVAQSLAPARRVRGHRLRVIGTVDFTLRKPDGMPGPEFVRKVNQAIRLFFRRVERKFRVSRKEYGYGWMDEFGDDNSNLHAHGVYAGPYLSQGKNGELRLTRIWREILAERGLGDGRGTVQIKRTRNFALALAHTLAYTNKPVHYSRPERAAELEVAFHGVRRFHTLACFYNVKAGDALEAGMDGFAPNCCPICGGGLMRCVDSHFRPVADLQREGLRNIYDVRLESNREKVFGRRGPPL